MLNAIMRLLVRTLAAGLTAAALHHFVDLPWTANRLLLRIDRLSLRAMESGHADDRVLRARANLELLATIESASVRSVDYYIQLGVNHRLANDLEGAIRVYARSLLIDQRPELYVERARTFMFLGRNGPASEDMAYAARFNPNIKGWTPAPLRDAVEKAMLRKGGPPDPSQE